MINSVVCVNCICLPVCLNKNDNKLLEDCCFFSNTLINISYSIPVNDFIDVYFKNLDRTVTVNRASFMFYVQINETTRHVLKFVSERENQC